MKKKLLHLAQFGIGLGLIAYLFGTMKDKERLWEALHSAAAAWPWLLAGNLVFGVCILMCAWRWQILLRSQDLRLPFRRSLTLFFIGQFFNSFLLGATGGDVVKAYYAARETHHRKAEAVSTVVLDRIIGLVALVSLVTIVLVSRLSLTLAHPETRTALLFFGAVFAVSLVVAVTASWCDVFERIGILRRFSERTRIGAVAHRMYATFRIGFRNPAVLWSTMAVSVLNHLLNVVSVQLLGRALNVRLPFVDFLTAFPVINAVAAVPLTPGGLGTREATAKAVLNHVFGVPEANAVLLSLLLYASVLLWSLVGGVVYMASGLKGKPAADLIREAESA